MLDIFANNLLPIFLCATTGWALGRQFNPDLRTVSRLSLYIFSPCLVFSAFTHTALSGGEVGQLALFTVFFNFIILALTIVAGITLRLDRRGLASLIIAAVFVNGGNYGLAVNQFAFGDAALQRAVVYYVFSTLLVFTLGVSIASLGKKTLWDTVKHTFTLPSTYAMLGAGLVGVTGWTVPVPIDRAITLLGQAAIPVMLVVLGLQLAETRRAGRAQTRRALVAVAVLLQLVAAPLVAVGLSAGLGLTGVARQAMVLEAAMPTAVITTLLAVEYDLDAALVTSTVLITTVLSPLTLTPLIAYLQR